MFGLKRNAVMFLPLAASIFLLSSISDLHAEPSAIEGRHLFNHYCSVCHGSSGSGDGINANELGDVHPADLTSESIDKLDDEEIYEVIEGGGAAIDISYYMPPWGEVLSEEQINSLVVYIRTLSEANGKPLPSTVRLSDLEGDGKEACSVCHVAHEDMVVPIAPNIGHEGSKWNRAALEDFLRKPERLRPNGFVPFTKSKMPNFFFKPEDLTSLVDYLMTLQDTGIDTGVLEGWDATAAAEIENGQILFEEEFACDGCHKRSASGPGGVVGPSLESAAERLKPEWMYYWLRDPQAMRKDTPMPNFKMSDEQARSVLAYVMSLSPKGSSANSEVEASPASIKKGAKLAVSKNCKGCHMMDSFNSQAGTMMSAAGDGNGE